MLRILTDRLFQDSLKLLGYSDIKLQTETDTNELFLSFKYNLLIITLNFHKENDDGEYIIHIDFVFKNKEYNCKDGLTTNLYEIKYRMGYAEQLFSNVIKIIKDNYGELFNV